MSEKQNKKEPTQVEEKIQQKVSRVATNSMQYLSGVTDEHLKDFNYIPESIHPYINEFIRGGKKDMDWLNDNIDKVDKDSDEYISMQKEMENIAKTFINVRGQVDKYKQSIGDFRDVLGSMSSGTQDSNYFLNSAVFGNQWDGMEIDKDGNFNFEVNYGTSKEKKNSFKLNDMSNITSGQSPIITEPWGSKAYVWKMAEKIKNDKDTNRPFDEDWTYKRVLNNFTEGGPNNTIGMAFTDMTGDNSSKSFAEMWEDGLKDQTFYIHPETGEKLPEDSVWMKDQNNADVLSKLLSRYVTNIMKDVYGVIDKDTGKLKKTKAVKELIEKYSK